MVLIVILLFYGWGNWDLAILSKISKTTQQINGRAGILTQDFKFITMIIERFIFFFLNNSCPTLRDSMDFYYPAKNSLSLLSFHVMRAKSQTAMLGWHFWVTDIDVNSLARSDQMISKLRKFLNLPEGRQALTVAPVSQGSVLSLFGAHASRDDRFLLLGLSRLLTCCIFGEFFSLHAPMQP